MLQKVVLLDFDGVVLKNHPTHKYIARQCEAFVQRYVKSRDAQVLHDINKELYKSSGHTVIGLRKMGYNVSVEEFNDFVYSKVKYSKVTDHLTSFHAQDCKDLITFCNKYRIQNTFGSDAGSWQGIYIASNAPDKWCFNVLDNMGVDMNLIHKTGLSSSGYVKPQKEFYDMVLESIKADTYIFVDDSLTNLLPVANNDEWTCCWMTNKGTRAQVSKNIYHIQSLTDVFEVFTCHKMSI